jgi:Fervidolysin N-terminal prodomain
MGRLCASSAAAVSIALTCLAGSSACNRAGGPLTPVATARPPASRLPPGAASAPVEVCDGRDNDDDGIVDNVNPRPCCPRGAAYVAGRLVVGFAKGTSRKRAEEIVRAAGASGIEKLLVDEPPLYQVSVPAGKETALVPAFRRFAEVTTAEPDFVPCLPERPPCERCPCGLVCPPPSPG